MRQRGGGRGQDGSRPSGEAEGPVRGAKGLAAGLDPSCWGSRVSAEQAEDP